MLSKLLALSALALLASAGQVQGADKKSGKTVIIPIPLSPSPGFGQPAAAKSRATPKCEGEVLATCCPKAQQEQPFPYCAVGPAESWVPYRGLITDVKFDERTRKTTYQIGPKKPKVCLCPIISPEVVPTVPSVSGPTQTVPALSTAAAEATAKSEAGK